MADVEDGEISKQREKERERENYSIIYQCRETSLKSRVACTITNAV